VVAAEPVPAVEGLPDPVAGTRARILAAATAQDYDGLEPLVDPESFLSDAGFGADPVAYWRDRGTGPLAAMAALLALPQPCGDEREDALSVAGLTQIRSETCQWRRGPQTLSGSASSRGVQLRPYVAPRLGILADGTWFFFIEDAAP
jgi:hypothetical protein